MRDEPRVDFLAWAVYRLAEAIVAHSRCEEEDENYDDDGDTCQNNCYRPWSAKHVGTGTGYQPAKGHQGGV